MDSPQILITKKVEKKY